MNKKETMEDDSSLHTTSFVLQNVPVVIEKILNPLPVKTLNTCARVCKTWSHIVGAIKQSRKSLNWACELCNDDDAAEDLVHGIKTFVQNLNTEPSYLLMFCSTNLYEKPLKVPSRHEMRCPRAAKCEIMEIGDLMKSLLPKKCKFLSVSADGVVGTSCHVKQNTTFEIEGGQALSLLLLPKLKDLEIFTFTVDIYTYANRMDEGSLGLFDVTQVSTVPEDRNVKSILFFCDEPFCPPEIGYTLLQHYNNSVVAGGYVDNLILPEPCSHDPTGQSMASLMCVAFCGPSLRVASVLIKEDVRTSEDVEKAVKKLKDCNLPEENSFAFMFACVGRGNGHYGASNFESQVFRKHFPKTPLLGFFGNGEVGFNYLHKYDPSETNNTVSCTSSTSSTLSKDKGNGLLSEKPLPKLYHAYTTVLCLFSIAPT